MHTLVQDGIKPLTEIQMLAVVSTIDVTLEELRNEGPIKFSDLVGIMHDPETDWTPDVGRPPTGLEVMSACCLLETRGLLGFDFIDGLMHVAHS
jgi:hypothetical protein